MHYRSLGKHGPRVSALGLGCMGMSHSYGAHDETESMATLRHAFDRGVTFFDTADVYGNGSNEELLGRAIAGRRDQFVIATKFGFQLNTPPEKGPLVCGKPEYVRASCEASLRRLGIDSIDLYYLHRVDPTVQIEDTVGAMAELVREGKVKYLGLSEAGSDSLRRASAIHPISALQSEYSLWTRDPEQGVLATCRELGIGFVPFSPLGRGFLTGQIKRFEDFAQDDQRRRHPRFQGDNFARNLELVRKIQELATARGYTAAQLALAWVMAQGDDLVPIPGTGRVANLAENLGSLEVKLSKADLAEIEAAFPSDAVAGLRYPEGMMRLVDR